MKAMKYKLISFCFITMSVSLYAIQTKTKEIRREIEVDPKVEVVIKNQFGNLTISSWDQNKVIIEVKITVKGNNQKRVNEKLDQIDVEFDLSPKFVSAKTKIDEGWGYKWFNSNRLRYQIDYHVKLPKSSAVDLNNDYGTIVLNELEGSAKISCDYGKLLIGDLHHQSNFLSFDYTSHSTIDFINGGEINADYSGFEVLEGGKITLNADYTHSKFDKIDSLGFRNDYGKLRVEEINTLFGAGDFLTLQIGQLDKNLNLNLEYGNARVDRVNPSVQKIVIDSEFTGITLGVDPMWEFTYNINLEFAHLKSNLSLKHLIVREQNTEKSYSGYLTNKNTTNRLQIESEYGAVKLKQTH
jgi:hypothetical protein